MLVGTWHLFLMQVSGLLTHCCGMDPIHQLAFVNQCGCVGHSGTNSMPRLIPQAFSEVEWVHTYRQFIIGS